MDKRETKTERNWARVPQMRWTCGICGGAGWFTPGQTFNPILEHDTPNGKKCRPRKGARD